MRIKNTILKLVYKRDFFDISVMKPGGRVVTTIMNDGKVTFKEYNPGSRKVHSVYTGICSHGAFDALCTRIEECIEFADRLDFYCDDSSEELKIYHEYGRVQTMDRGLGYEDIHIGEIMHEFFEKDVIIENEENN